MFGSLVPDPADMPRPLSLPSASFGALAGALRQHFAENFGYARSLPFLRGLIEYTFDTPSDPRVYIGNRAHLFYNGDSAADQSTGSAYRT